MCTILISKERDRMKTFFCQITVRNSIEILAEYIVEASDWYYARHIAANRFVKENKLRGSINDWYVDSCEI